MVNRQRVHGPPVDGLPSQWFKSLVDLHWVLAIRMKSKALKRKKGRKEYTSWQQQSTKKFSSYFRLHLFRFIIAIATTQKNCSCNKFYKLVTSYC
ncbi:hypothetical protein AVEN_200790-1 [Araneus ventricosus]|uniref:Uncharacterized protein n=1 Tax=Araneus ventricosus TaxID=182803 RepID=A0A4Y2DWI4_ARAVE|nr:hypothetical protein AVEN_200790-1 [Araneus ventricosus]